MPVRVRAIVVCSFVLGVAPLGAQSPSADSKPPTFDVASVKRNTSGSGRFSILVQPGGRLVVSNVTLELLVENAYQLEEFQLVGAPGWVKSDHFDIEATGAGDVSNLIAAERNSAPTRLQLMIRSLLADRFKLALHAETRTVPVYELLLARKDGRLGQNLTRSATDCWAPAADQPAPPDASNTCTFGGTAGRFHAASASMLQIARALAQHVSRPVLDRTGLDGLFDVDLTWAPDNDPNGPSLFTAVQEQLGLKLESTSGPADVYVIDHVEHPTVD